MVDGITFKESIKIEKEKWSKMDKAQKWDYFKTYYMATCLVIIAVIVAIGFYIHSYRLNKREVLLGGYFLNIIADDSLYSYVNEDYFAYLGGDSKTQQMDITQEHYLELTESGYDNTAYATDMSIVAMFSTGSLDFMFLDDTTLERYSSQGVFMDLTQILTEEQYAALADHIVDVTDAEEGTTYPGAICLTGTEFAEKYSVYSSYGANPYLVFVATGKNLDDISQFVDYLFFQD